MRSAVRALVSPTSESPKARWFVPLPARRSLAARRSLMYTSGPTAVLTPFVFVGNNEYQLSGLELGGRKKLDVGRLHVCLAPGMSRRRVVGMIIVAIFGDVSRLEGFESLTACEVTLDASTARLRVSRWRGHHA